jgi:SAM-dependent methyltransferase
MPRNWDEHYSDPVHIETTPEPLLTGFAELLKPGRALDLACGAGRHALYLASLGWEVTAVDASPVALAALRGRAASLELAVDARLADLERGEFRIVPAAYDLICDFFYLQRDLFPRIRDGARMGGAFVGAIHLADGASGPRNPAYLMAPGELRREFEGWKILYYSEGGEPGRSRRSARIVARRA